MIRAMPLSFAAKPTCTGDRVRLRPVSVADVPDMVKALRDPESTRLTGTHATFTAEQLRRWAATRADQADRLDLTIIELATGDYAGEVVLNNLDVPNRACSLRISLAGPEFFGRGLGSEAIRLVLAHAFATGVHRVALEVYDFNPRARHVYAKLGFRHEGTLRQALCWEGEWIDAHVMSILAPEWPAWPDLGSPRSTPAT